MRPLGADHEAVPLAGWAGYGYCASHSRFFWGLRLHLVCTPAGLPVTFALANPKIDEREVAIDIFDHDPTLLADRAGQMIIADKGYVSAEFERCLTDHGVELVRPARKDERPRRGAAQLRPLRRSSNRSTTPSKASSAWNNTAGAAHRASPSASSTSPRPDRRDLAQLPQPPADPPIADRLRPLTPWISHLDRPTRSPTAPTRGSPLWTNRSGARLLGMIIAHGTLLPVEAGAVGHCRLPFDDGGHG